MNTILIIATLVGIVEAYMILFCGFRLVGFSPNNRRLFSASIVIALFVRASRYVLYSVFNAPFGFHIITSVAALFLLGFLWLKAPPLISAIAVAIGYMLLLLGTMLVFLLMPHVDPNNFTTLVKLIAIEEAPLVIATLVIWKTRASVVPTKVTRSLRG